VHNYRTRRIGRPLTMSSPSISDQESGVLVHPRGWLLGARAHKLDAYLRALREALDPDGIMNPAR
jgi:FAD/FMN-containing dehydrogenase